MTREQYIKAEPIMQKIRELERMKALFKYPAECYHVEFRSNSGSVEISAGAEEIGTKGIGYIIDDFICTIDNRLEDLKKELEEI